MVILLPRLPVPAAETLIEEHLSDGFAAWSGFNPHDLPAAVRFAATGGSRVSPTQLAELRDGMLQIARSNGFGDKQVRDFYAKFDAEMAALLAEGPLFASGEALRDDVWTFIGTSLAPDLVHWRFGATRERFLGGVRNTFQRLWMRGRALDRGADHCERWQLLHDLTEDALVQITERPSIGGDPVLARAIAEAWIRASLHHGRGAMEPIMRRAVLRARILNEIRSLADLRPEQLASVLDDTFDIPAKNGAKVANVTARRVTGADETEGLRGSGAVEENSKASQDSERPMTHPQHSVPQAAMRVLEKARERSWVSPKSSRALSVLLEGQRKLTSRERNALAHLLGRMRSAKLLHEEVSQLFRASGSPASPSDELAAAESPSRTRNSRRAIVRAR